MKLVPENINEAIKHLKPRTQEEIYDILSPGEKKYWETEKNKLPRKSYPHGYKQMRILQAIFKTGKKRYASTRYY